MARRRTWPSNGGGGGSPSVHDVLSDVNVFTHAIPDHPIWCDPERFLVDEQHYRDTRCDGCEAVTAGSVVAGVHVQRCEHCLRAAMVEALALVDAQHTA